MRHMIRHRRWAVASVLGLGLLALGAVPAAGQLIINEILADPATDWDGDGAVDYRSDEWVEILNAGAAAVDLSTYGLMDASATMPRLLLSGSLGAGETLLVLGSAAVAWQEAVGLAASGLSLNNSGDEVVLVQVTSVDPPAFEEVDRAIYPDHAADDDRACGWDTHRTEWILYDGLTPYGGDRLPVGTGCPPTPGARNLCNGQVETTPMSFGTAKAMYR
ncbi:MAG: lamin tail domain-containing protein [bacterium]|nr:lamin tail domain-containing protein [bacterium]